MCLNKLVSSCQSYFINDKNQGANYSDMRNAMQQQLSLEVDMLCILNIFSIYDSIPFSNSTTVQFYLTSLS